jgi:hypothetical protein
LSGARSSDESQRGPASVRAHFLKLALRALARCEPELRRQASGRLGGRAALIDDASALAWLPIEHLLWLCELADELGGEAAARQVVLQTMRLACDQPPWGRLVRVTIAAFGLSAPAAARWAPPLYRLAFRDTGRMRVPEVNAQAARVSFDRVPSTCLAQASYVRALGYALEFFFTLTGTPGEVRLLRCQVERGEIEFRLLAHGAAP